MPSAGFNVDAAYRKLMNSKRFLASDWKSWRSSVAFCLYLFVQYGR